MLFLYKTPRGYIATAQTVRDLRAQHDDIELITSSNTPEGIAQYIERYNIMLLSNELPLPAAPVVKKPAASQPLTEFEKKTRRRRTPEQNAYMSLRLKGRVNVGSDNPSFGKPVPEARRRAISRSKKLNTLREALPRRWCVDSQGNEHYMPGTFILPDGWRFGRVRGRKRTRHSPRPISRKARRQKEYEDRLREIE